jgi:hypothetical protein
MKKQVNKKTAQRASQSVVLGVTVAGTALLAGCAASTSSTSSSTTSSDITISGKMSATSTSARQVVSNGRLIESNSGGQSAVDISTYKASCVTLSTSPTAGTGSFDSTGKFSVKITGGKGAKVGCFILDSSESVVATMVFKDSTKKSMSGTSSTSTSTALSDDAELGELTLDLDTGKVEVDTSKIVTASGASAVATTTVSSDAFDFSGSWKIGEYADASTDEKKLYKVKLCDDTHKNADGTDCNGPPKDQVIFVKRATGKASDGSNAYGLMLWESDDAHKACSGGGSDRYLGQSFASIKTGTGVDFTDSGLKGEEFTFTSTVTISGASQTLTDGWKASGATAQWEQRNCAPTSDGGHKCTDGAGKTRTDYGGGCQVTSTGKALQIQSNEWSSVVISSCTSSTDSATGIISNSCTGTFNSTAITCKNKYKEDTGFNHSTVASVVSAGALCSSISATTYPMLQLQCYANYYYMFVQNAKSRSGCFKNTRFNYAATTAADFLGESSNPTPDALIFRNLVEYASDGLSATMYDEHEEYRGIRTQDNGKESFTNCKVFTQESLIFSKLDATSMKMVYKSSTKNASKDKPACEAAYGGTGKEDAFLIKLTKQ